MLEEYALLFVWMLALSLLCLFFICIALISRWRSVDPVDDLDRRLVSRFTCPGRTKMNAKPSHFDIDGISFVEIHINDNKAPFILEYSRFFSILRDFLYLRFRALPLACDVRVVIGRLLCSLLSVTCFVTNDAATLPRRRTYAWEVWGNESAHKLRKRFNKCQIAS
jgi:hypothetical protein